MEKQYTPEQLAMAENHIAQALAETRAALLQLGEPVPDGNVVMYNPDNEVSCSYWYIHTTREALQEVNPLLHINKNQLQLWEY